MLSEKEKIMELYMQDREKIEFDELTEDESFMLLLLNDSIRENKPFREVMFNFSAMNDYFQYTGSRLIGERLIKIIEIIQETKRIMLNEKKADASYAPNS